MIKKLVLVNRGSSCKNKARNFHPLGVAKSQLLETSCTFFYFLNELLE